METKQQTTQFLVLKSTTAFNTLAIIVMAAVVLHNYQRVREIDSDLNSCQKSLKIMREDLRSFKLKEAFAKSVRLTRRVRQIAQPRNTKASSEKDFKVTTKPPITRARVQSVADTNITAGKNLTDFCPLCEKECARYLEKDQKNRFTYQSAYTEKSRPAGQCVIVQGRPGIPGRPGPKGSRGREGEKGSRGKRGKRGKQGIRGPTGLPGKHGPQGHPGERGIMGKRGPTGLKGIKGDTSIVGIKGDKGDPGNMGPTGEKGMKGEKGVNGRTGEKGNHGGQKGDTGTKGDQGARGETGPRGCSGTLIVKPSFEISQENITVNEDDTSYLVCNASANPVSRITWLKNGVSITGSRYRMVQKIFKVTGDEVSVTCRGDTPHPITEGKLLIHRNQAQDAGRYTCRATNFMGAAEYHVTVIVQLKVRFSTLPRSTVVVQNNNVELRCQATGFPKPLITWHKKGGGRMPARHSVVNGNLRINSIRKSREGVYVCTASNVLGFQQAEATITVNVPPSFVTLPQSQRTIRKGQLVTFPCSALGTPIPVITWSKVGGAMPRGRSRTNDRQATIERVEFADRGTYTCRANNIIGSVETQVSLTVLVPPEVTSRPRDIEIGYIGRNKTLKCRVFGFPRPNVTWSGPTVTRQKATVVPEGLLITSVQLRDSGNYYCRASNALGNVELRTLLIVQDVVLPGFVTKPQSFAAYPANQRVSATCGATGNPKPTVEWSRNGTVVHSGVSGTTSQKTLVIATLTTSNQDNYTCTARNELGDSISTHTFLDVNECLGSSHGCGDKMCRNTAGSCICSGDITVSNNCGYVTRWSPSNGYITSPNYPSNYADNTNCYWRLQSDRKIRLTFSDFHTEATIYDPVTIYDGYSSSSTQIGKYGGSSGPTSPILSSSRYLYITFTTDGSGTRKGFKVVYNWIP